MKFTKMHGCGNDYIYVNCFEKEYEDKSGIALKYSDRHFGIGGDGVVFICKSDIADAQMRMFNMDGSEGKMCGNAIRCVGKYLYDNGLTDKKEVDIETLSGIKHLVLEVENGKVKAAKVNMGKAEFAPDKIPVVSGGDKMVNEPFEIGGKTYNITCVSMGNPHCVTYMDDVANLEIEKIGPLFENNEIFPERVNTEFIKVIDSNTLEMRVWERGSGETFACGTGACAAVAASVANGYCREGEDITVRLRGGDLVINYTSERVMMSGPAVKVFEGETDYED